MIGDPADEIRRNIRRSAEEALGYAAHLVLMAAETNVPKGPTGRLEASGRVEDEPWGYIVSFAGPYAAVQHENLTYEHPHGGQAKYLESALLSVAPTIPRIVAARVHATLEGRRRGV